MANRRMLFLHALSSVHIGTGSGVAYIDLPLAREKATNWPYAPGSGLKGVLSDAHDASDPKIRRADPMLRAAFGVADDQGDQTANSGALVFSDAQLALMPVRSVYGTFAWVTCPLALARLQRDLKEAGIAAKTVPPFESDGKGLTPKGVKSALTGSGRRAYLADVDVETEESSEARDWASLLAPILFGDAASQSAFQARFLILSDNSFTFFTEIGTEVVTRTRIDPVTKTVATGQLWTEESLPAESILASLVWCDRVYHQRGTIEPSQLLSKYCSGERPLQIGGKASVGRGRVRAIFAGA